MLLTDYSVQYRWDHEFDKTILRRELFPVNMRIYHTSETYRKLIHDIADYMVHHIRQTYEDYGTPKGISGANLAIPFNITRQELVQHCTPIGTIMRDNRRMFLSKKCWDTFKGYAYRQLHKMKTKEPVGKRKDQREKYGFDVKFAYNIVRLIDEAEQILTEGDIDLMRNREQLKAIRRGDWTMEMIEDYFRRKEKVLEEVHIKSNLPLEHDEGQVRKVLFQCLEHHYGNIEKCVTTPDKAETTIRQIRMLLDQAGY